MQRPNAVAVLAVAQRNSVFGIFVVPQAKTLKALIALQALADPDATVRFREHRKLTGLLEHIVGVVHARRLVMYSLYEPHRRLLGDPEGVVRLSDFGRHQVHEWISALLSTPGRYCAAATTPTAPAAAPHSAEAMLRRYLAYTDAAKNGAKHPCFGGWCHRFFFSVPIPAGLLDSPIPQLELRGMICGVFAFADVMRSYRADLTSDSDTSVKVLLNDGAHNEQIQWLHLEYEAANGCLATIDQVCHAHGEITVPADFSSRDRLAELTELAAQLGLSPSRIEAPSPFLDALDVETGRGTPRSPYTLLHLCMSLFCLLQVLLFALGRVLT
jgi:hypothetical protein